MKLYYHKTKFWIMVLALSAFTVESFGQLTIKGRVTDNQTNDVLPGVSVRSKATAAGAVTNANGDYQIELKSAADTLIFSFIGYTSKEIYVGSQLTIDVSLESDIQNLSEVVIMGYSEKKKNSITSSVKVVSGDKLKDVTADNIGTMLQGKVAGIQVVNNSGTPGSLPEIRIRGVSSINSQQQGPLYVVDGIIGGNYDPNDVESITVLKDAGATGMYGSQANGGVIVVTTKKSKGNKPVFEFKAVSGIRVADHGNVEMMDSKTLYEYHREYFRDPTYYVVDDRKFLTARPDSLLKVNTNWLKECFKPAKVQNYYLSSSGNTGKLQYYIGGSLFNEDGTFINTSYKRLNLRANTTYNFNSKVSLTNNINLSGSKTQSADYMNLYYAYTSMPWDNPYNADGTPRSFKNVQGIWSKDKINPIQAADNSELSSKNGSVDYDLGLNIKLFRWLTFSSSNRFSINANSDKTFYSKLADNLSYTGTGYVYSNSAQNYSSITTDLLKFNFDGSVHSFSGLFGVEAQSDNSENTGVAGTGLPEGLNVPSVASTPTSITGSNAQVVMQSLISQFNYNFKGTYFISGSYRVDQSSAFPVDNRTASFPSISGAWLLSNESFLKDKKAISNLKLKASWGKTGMKDISPLMYLEQFKFTTQYDGQTAAIPAQSANPNLKWEQTTQVNAGLELGLFNRITLDVDIYKNTTNNLLMNRELSPSVGFRTQWQNYGSVVNNGVEVALNCQIIKSKDFGWNLDFTLGYNSNKLKDYGNDSIFMTNNYGIRQVYHNNGTLYSWYAREYYGIDKNDGSMLWVGKDGKPTHDYSDARFIEDGSPFPKYQGGFATEFRYKSLTLTSTMSYVYGNKIYNYFRRYVDNDLQDIQFNVMMPRSDWKLWQKPGDEANHPLPQNTSNSFDPSTRFIEDGSYFKIRNITLSYNLPFTIVKKFGMSQITIALAVDNAFTFTKFWGQDPEVSLNSANNNLPGYAEFKYPNYRQFNGSLSFKF